MKIVQPSVTIIQETNPLKRIELAARVCYKSEGKITEDSALPLIKRLIARGHMTPLEHARVALDTRNVLPRSLEASLRPEPYGFRDRVGHPEGDMDTVYASVRDLLAVGYGLEDVVKLPNAPDYMTAHLICDRGIANELITHRVLSKAQESTRYCKYATDVSYVYPVPFPPFKGKPSPEEVKREVVWRSACTMAERHYAQLISFGASPQEARNVLPLSLKTELIVTTTYDNWAGILALRLHKDAHPQMVYLMELLVNNKLFPKDKIEVPNAKQRPHACH